MTDRYVVVGNPVEHSKSPLIHAEFARQTGHDIDYRRLLAPLGGFVRTLDEFRANGGCGANVTLPFKTEAYAYAQRRSPRAEAAGAANTLVFTPAQIYADNTDGVGLTRDIERNLGVSLHQCRLLIVGAGGAARGVIQPLLERGVALTLANRTLARARELAEAFARWGPVGVLDFDALRGSVFDIVVNASAASLAGEMPQLPSGILATDGLAYDMMYGKGPTPFLQWAQAEGCTRLADGLGMLVEQAAESFLLWRGVNPDTAPVLALLRGS